MMFASFDYGVESHLFQAALLLLTMENFNSFFLSIEARC